MTDRTAAALASALPAGITHSAFLVTYDRWALARLQAQKLAESGWRLVHTDGPPQTLAEHPAEALALIHDHVEASDE
jgi:hypothetical protein